MHMIGYQLDWIVLVELVRMIDAVVRDFWYGMLVNMFVVRLDKF